MTSDVVLTEISGPVATITINRPEKMNALNAAVRQQFLATLDALAADDDVRVAIAEGLRLETSLISLAFASDDRREGVRAFLDKRKPAFTGR